VRHVRLLPAHRVDVEQKRIQCVLGARHVSHGRGEIDGPALIAFEDERTPRMSARRIKALKCGVVGSFNLGHDRPHGTVVRRQLLRQQIRRFLHDQLLPLQ
jgi:hypothetical protein